MYSSASDSDKWFGRDRRLGEGSGKTARREESGDWQESGDTTPCKATPVILHGVVSPDRSAFTRGCIPLYLLYTSLCTGELNAIRKHK